ncbi:hypothetical protein I4U23_019768 [Adineta vaga]|nr:hypothetical protein I4U23_019768 [Adineta vaga]
MLFYMLEIYQIVFFIVRICQGMERPLVIGHRGSAYLPELTLESQSMAHALHADMIEIDVCLTRDNQLIVIHDLYLNAISNVQELYPNRSSSDGYHYVIDFDLVELRNLTIHERIKPFTNIQTYPLRFPWSSSISFSLSTLNQTLELLLGLRRSTNRQYELLIEIKNPEYHSQHNRCISCILISTLDTYNLTESTDPIVIQTFHIEELIYIREKLSRRLRLVGLLTWNWLNESSSNYDFYRSEQGLQNLSSILHAIAPNMELLVNFNTDGSIIDITNLTSLAHKYKLAVYPWTFRYDTYKGNFQELIEFFSQKVHVDGFITINLIFIGVNVSIASDDSDLELPIERRNFSVCACENSSIINIPLFECELPTEYLQDCDNQTCYATTAEPTEQTTTVMKLILPSYQCPDENYMGIYCNVTNDICAIYEPCENYGICISNKSLPLEYSCQCLSDEYSGYNCENDNRLCKNGTCLHDGDCIKERISADNKTTFACLCQRGYDGTRCELVSNMCTNITCENKGICRSSHLSWKCHCIDSTLYSGVYCEHQSTSLTIKKVLSQSFVSIAIAAIIAVFLFVIIMDVLKYVFQIDPIIGERRMMKNERMKKLSDKNKKRKKMMENYVNIAIRFAYKNFSETY